MTLRPEESKALLEIPSALARLTELLTEHARVVKRATRRHARATKRYLTAADVAHELRYRDASSVWAMPEVMAERIYPTGTSTPRWSHEGLARAVAKMPREPRSVGRKGVRREAA